MSEFLLIKNWQKYQSGRDGKRSEWIKDYTSKDSDPDYSKLTILQRYILDGICRLTGREGKPIPNDPLWVCRALCTLPQERHNIPAAMQQLVKSGFLVLCNHHGDSSLSHDKRREEEKREEKSATAQEVSGVVSKEQNKSENIQVTSQMAGRALCESLGMSGALLMQIAHDAVDTYIRHMTGTPEEAFTKISGLWQEYQASNQHAKCGFKAWLTEGQFLHPERWRAKVKPEQPSATPSALPFLEERRRRIAKAKEESNA